MTQEQIHELVNTLHKAEGVQPSLIETHASWVVLTRQFAYKIKKPVRFSFLDFSTLARRKRICEDEVKLNRRLTDIYLGTVPVTQQNGSFSFNSTGEIADYAVKMKRLDPERQMHLLLEKNAVKVSDVEALAEMIACFHRQAEILSQPFDPNNMLEDFADIRQVEPFLSEHFDKKAGSLIENWISLAEKTIRLQARRFSRRVEEGFIKDGHGDLHSGNIFLLEKPVIFDCIEFNSHFRANDVLSELAFLAMDLEQFGRPDLKDVLMKKYGLIYPCLICPEDEVIFQYYLLYRASVRLKITALKWKGMVAEAASASKTEEESIRSLVQLCMKYAGNLEHQYSV